MGVGFPFDSAMKLVEGVPVYDRAVASATVADLLKSFFRDGVFGGNDSTMFRVMAKGGMTVEVASGECLVRGRYTKFEEPVLLALSEAHQALARVDAVVLRLDLSSEARNISLKVVTGVADGKLNNPPITRTDLVWELQLCLITVRPSTREVLASDINDTRLDSVACGYVGSLKHDIDAEEFYRGLTVRFDAWLNGIKGALSGDSAGALYNMIEAVDGKIAGIGTRVDSLDAVVEASEETTTKLGNDIVELRDELSDVSDLADHVHAQLEQVDPTVRNRAFLNETVVLSVPVGGIAETVAVFPDGKRLQSGFAYAVTLGGGNPKGLAVSSSPHASAVGGYDGVSIFVANERTTGGTVSVNVRWLAFGALQA